MNFNKKDSVANAVDSVLQQEALKGGQKKLDKNKNNKLDADDFRILRGEKKVSEEIDVNDTSEDGLGGQKKIKRKDDVGPSGNFKSSKVRFHAGPKNESLEEPLEKVLADTAPHSGIIKTVMATDDLDDTNKSTENKTKLKMKEESEQLDEKKWIAGAIKKPGALTAAAKRAGESTSEYIKKHEHEGGKAGHRARLAKTLKSFKEEYEENSIYDQMIQEVLGKDASAGDWIHDFVHSDNPKFAGKSKEMRKKMALAAYYAKQRNEEVEQLREFGDLPNIGMGGNHPGPFGVYHRHGKGEDDLKIVSKHKTLDSALKHVDRLEKKTGKEHVYGNLLAHKPEHGEIPKKFNEEVELDEGMGDAVKKVAKAAHKALTGGSDEDQLKNLQKKMGVPQTGKKPVQKEEVEQIDEISKSTLGSYVKNAARDLGASRKLAADFENNAKSARKQSAKDANTRLSDKFKDTANKRHAGIDKAVERLTREDIEQVEEGWDDMLKAVEKRRGPQPSGGSGVKQGSRYGGSKQKEKPEHDEDEGKKKVTEAKRPEDDSVPFDPPYNTTSRPADVVDKSGAQHTPMSRAKHLARLAMSRVKKDLGKKGK